MFEKEISDKKEIIYEVFSEEGSSSDEEYVYMMIDQFDLSSSSYVDPPE